MTSMAAMPAGDAIERAVSHIRAARALVIATGAGASADSGLPTFRDENGYWSDERIRALANPEAFAERPAEAWRFYLSRVEAASRARPHAGYEALASLARHVGEYRCITSNVDAMLERAGLPSFRVCGDIFKAQCQRRCGIGTYPLDDATDATTVPKCPRCGAIARPAVCLFGDGDWEYEGFLAEQVEYQKWLSHAPEPLVVLEVGAGRRLPIIRGAAESAARKGILIRVNSHEAEVNRGCDVSLGGEALPVLTDLSWRVRGCR
jgi:NAD-dependent SIR2 family protein deacetylase